MKNVDLKFPMWQEVYFFLMNSLSMKSGKVVGYFLTVTDSKVDDPKEEDINYSYQVEYYLEMKEGGERMFLAALPDNEMFVDEDEAKKAFKPWREKAIGEAIEEQKKIIEGASTNKKFHVELEKEALSEIDRLKEELKKEV